MSHDAMPLLLLVFAGILWVSANLVIHSMNEEHFQKNVCSKCAHCNAERAKIAAAKEDIKQKIQAAQAARMGGGQPCQACGWSKNILTRKCVNRNCKNYEDPRKSG